MKYGGSWQRCTVLQRFVVPIQLEHLSNSDTNDISHNYQQLVSLEEVIAKMEGQIEPIEET